MIDAGRDTPLARFTLGELLHRDGELDAALTQQIAETAVPFVEIRTGGSVA